MPFYARTNLHKAELTRDNAQSISNNTRTKINLDTQTYDDGGIADPTTNNRFDIVRAGRYLVVANVSISGIDNTEFFRVDIDINGTKTATSNAYSPVSNAVPRVSIAGTFDLSVNDTVELSVQHNEGASRNTLTTIDAKPKMSVIEIL